MDADFSIRVATRSEVDVMKYWAQIEHWNPGKHDYDCFYETDPSGYFVGELNGEIIASVSGVKTADGFGFIGFYIVKPEFRGKGYGIPLFAHALKYLEGRNIGLDGVVPQQANYVKSGFTLAYDHLHYGGCGTKPLETETKSVIDQAVDADDVFTKAADVDFQKVLAYDASYYGYERSTFLKHFIAMPEMQSFCIIEDDQIKSFGAIRKAFDGYRIGPLYAESLIYAEKMLNKLRSLVSCEENVWIDIPSPNAESVALVEGLKFTQNVVLGRMYIKGPPEGVNLQHVYGIASLELG